jgi:hypothetical protein
MSPKPRKRKRFKSKAGENRATWSMRNDDKGAHPLLWVDEAEWRTWPVCRVCKRLVRPSSYADVESRSGRYWRTMHAGCKASLVIERQSELDLDLDISPDEIDKIVAQHKARVRWERGQA